MGWQVHPQYPHASPPHANHTTHTTHTTHATHTACTHRRCRQKSNIIRTAYQTFEGKLKSDANLLLVLVLYVNAPAYRQQKDAPDAERQRGLEATGIPWGLEATGIPCLKRTIGPMTVPASQQGNRRVLERAQTMHRQLEVRVKVRVTELGSCGSLLGLHHRLTFGRGRCAGVLSE